MKKLLTLILILFCALPSQAQFLKKNLKFTTFYTAVNGNNSLADVNTYTLLPNGTLEYGNIKTPFDYTLTFGARKIARLGYENRANVFYNGTENSYADAATIGRVKGLEFLFEANYKRQQGLNFIDQQHFLRYVADKWVVKLEYVQDGFADIKYYESSQRYRHNINSKLSFNLGIAQRISEPYGFNPLNGLTEPDYHLIAINEGYSPTEFEGEWYTPEGDIIAENSEIWRGVVIPDILSNYVEDERNLLPNQWNHSLVVGYDFYHYTKDFWLHSWGNIMPYHLPLETEYSYYKLNEGQWVDYGAGLILGYKINKSLGLFLEGKYNKYWNRNWHDFSVGFNYVII